MIVQAFDILELFIELLHTRMAMIKMQKTVPFDLKEAICTLIYAAPRLDITELHEVRKQLIYKYGESFGNDAMENRGNCVNPKVVEKLCACSPEQHVVFEYLGNIAKKYNVDWCCPYEQNQQPLIDNSNFMIPPSIHQPLVPFQPNFNNGNDRFMPSGGQNVLPGTGYSQPQNPPSNFNFPSVPNNQNNYSNNFPSVPSNNQNNYSNNFPSVPSNNQNNYSNNFPTVPNNNNGNQNNYNSSNFDFPSVPSNNSSQTTTPPPYTSSPSNGEVGFNFPSVPSGNNNSTPSNQENDLDDLSARFNRLKKK